ncbi:MAG: hypothetical protein H0X29_10760 [Parachlamydiaceae bacterium]|nr:hypothetical protein [Parachlamydiaceae bacterium]
MNSREAAYLALLTSLRHEGFISQSLEQWQSQHRPTSADFAFAQEIAFGSARLALSLDYFAAKLSSKGKLSLKLKERALVRTAIYQYVFMSRVPLYAIANETIELAKKHCHYTFVSYLNALLRQLSTSALSESSLPQGLAAEDLSIRYSYPSAFISALIAEYGLPTTLDILQAGNTAPKTMARIRPNAHDQEINPHLLPISNAIAPMAMLDSATNLANLAASPNYYIQNITPATLVAELAAQTKPPRQILDLCASPGGKLLAAHDQFPEAKLFANDVSQEKIGRLSQNISKYNISASLNCGPGENYVASHPFDLIILDVPCSNSGVLNKRPEARWRITEEALRELEEKQMCLLTHAASLLALGGCIWYLTCSILKQENEKLIKKFCKKTGLKSEFSKTILPNISGWDGGFACLLTFNSDLK